MVRCRLGSLSTFPACFADGALREEPRSAEDDAMRFGMMDLKAWHEVLCNKMSCMICGQTTFLSIRKSYDVKGFEVQAGALRLN